jgi:ABC-type oligopeptide transport system substrate-binding subunit
MENITMKKLVLFAILTGLFLGLTGCGDEASKKEAERKAQREHMKQHVDTSGEKKITKLPL